MARPRSKKYAGLPDHVYLSGGRYVYRRPGQKDVRIAGASASKDQIWRSYHAQVGITSGASLKDLFRLYRESPGHKKKAPKTRKEYEKAQDGICALIVDGRKFGDLPYASITTGAVQAMMDFLSPTPVKANRWHSAMAVAFAWGKQRDKVTTNPCVGVGRYKEAGRTRYVTDEEYQTQLAVAPPKIAVAMELAYLCRLREVEIVPLKRSDARQDGLLATRVKGSKSQVIGNTERLEAVLARSKGLCDPESIYIVPAADGGAMTAQGFRTLWQRFRAKQKKAGKPIDWHFHDLKAKGVSDFEGDKKKASGHRTDAMADRYNRRLETVPATR